jgi:hypothetical protein
LSIGQGEWPVSSSQVALGKIVPDAAAMQPFFSFSLWLPRRQDFVVYPRKEEKKGHTW